MKDAHIMKPADIRRAVAEWTAQGNIVTVAPNGTMTITPPAVVPQKVTSFDQVDMRK